MSFTLPMTAVLAAVTAAAPPPARELGETIGETLRVRLPVGALVRTTDGGVLASVGRPGLDAPERVSFEVVGAIRPDPTNDGRLRSGVLLTTACADADGRLWQVTEHVSAHALWEAAWREPACYANAAAPIVPSMEHSSRRQPPEIEDRRLFREINGQIDDRSQRLVSVVLRPGAVSERAVFSLNERMFGYAMELCEERWSWAEDGHVSRHLALVLTLYTSPRACAGLDGLHRPGARPDVDLHELNPVRAWGIRLRPAWSASGGIAESADRGAWESRLRGIGLTPAEIEHRLRPVPQLRYHPPHGAPPALPASRAPGDVEDAMFMHALVVLHDAEDALDAVRRYLVLLEAGDYGPLYDRCFHATAREGTSRDAFIARMEDGYGERTTTLCREILRRSAAGEMGTSRLRLSYQGHVDGTITLELPDAIPDRNPFRPDAPPPATDRLVRIQMAPEGGDLRFYDLD